MLTLKRLGWTGLLIVAQPIKIIVTIIILVGVMLSDIGPEFMRELRKIWSER